MRTAIRAILRALKSRDGELSLLFVTSEEMATLNHNHMGRRGPTDVLSFPAATMPTAPGLSQPIGDIVLCLQQIFKQARTHRRMRRTEFAHVMIHGVLHLFGFDHDKPENTRRMRQNEKQMLAEISKCLIGVFQ